MSLDPLFVAAALTVGPAAGLVLWTGSRTRYSANAFAAARRLLRGSLLLTLLLAAVATFRWSDATMGSTTSPTTGAPARGDGAGAGLPPLAGFVVLAALAGTAQAAARWRRSAATTRTRRSRLDIRRRARLDRRAPLGLVGKHAVPVPRARGAARGPVVAPAVPDRRRERSTDRRVGAEPVG